MSLSKQPLRPRPLEALRGWLATGTLPCPSSEDEALALARAAGAQGLLGLLDEAWPADAALPAHGAPPSARVALREAHRELLVRGVGQLELAARAQRLLLERGLRALPLKGAAIAETLYDSVAHRPMDDVDLLALDAWDASLEALVDDGLRVCDAADHATVLVDRDTGFRVELHHSLTSCPGFFPVDRDGLWARSRPGRGQVPRLPAAEDLLAHLALHAAFQHGLVLSLVQFLDFRRLLERAAVPVAAAIEAAAAARAEAAVAAALEAAAIVVGARVPRALSAALGSRMPAGLRGALDRARLEPLLLVTPSEPGLARVRWALAKGRRAELVRGTLAPRGASGTPGGAGVWTATGRLVGLARRWLWPLAPARVGRRRLRPES
jgi:hypothetical protein